MSTVTADPDVDAGGTREEKLLEKFRRWFRQSADATQPQRERVEEDLRFQVAENQWSDEAKTQRQGGVGAPARPILSVSKVDQPIRLVMSSARKAKLGVTIHPVSEDASEDAARVREGLYSSIQRNSNASDARLWALDLAAKAGGPGWYRVDVKPDEDSFEQGDLVITIDRIFHQSCVYYDPAAKRPDFSDGRFMFFAEWVPWDTFRDRYPDSRAVKDGAANSGWFEGMNQLAPDWVKQDGDSQAVLVAECFWKESKPEKINEDKPWAREREKVTIMWALMAGDEFLEKPREWLGHLIPFIPVLGRELQPFDDQRRIEGMIRPARDAQKAFNYFLSTFVERVALEPKVPYVGPAGTFEGFEDKWQNANTVNYAFLEYNLKTDGSGGQGPPPSRAQLDQTGMSMAHQGVMLGDTLIQAATATYDPSLGKATNGHESGRHALALQSQGDDATSDFLDSLANVSMRYEAMVVLDLMPIVYDAPGRIVRILGGDDQKSEEVMLNAPFVMDPKTKRPKRADRDSQGRKIKPAPEAKHYDLSKGRYSVAPTVGKSNQTRLQEGGEQITRLLEAEPSLVPIIGDIWMRFQDIPGGKEIADRLAKLREATHPELSDDPNNSPEQLQAKAKGLEQQLQQLTQQLQQAGQIIQTKQVEAQATLQGKQLEVQGRIQIQQMANEQAITIQTMKDATQIEMARISAAKEALDQQMAALEERLALHQTQAHELGMAAVAQQHAQQQQQAAAAQDAQSQQAGQEHEAGMQQNAQDAAAEQAQQQAAMAATQPQGGE